MEQVVFSGIGKWTTWPWWRGQAFLFLKHVRAMLPQEWIGLGEGGSCISTEIGKEVVTLLEGNGHSLC